MTKNDFGVFEVTVPPNADGSPGIPHGSRVKIHLETQDGSWVDKIPAWIKFAVQAPGNIPFDGIYYDPPKEEQYEMKWSRPDAPEELRIYEALLRPACPRESRKSTPTSPSRMRFCRELKT